MLLFVLILSHLKGRRTACQLLLPLPQTSIISLTRQATGTPGPANVSVGGRWAGLRERLQPGHHPPVCASSLTCLLTHSSSAWQVSPSRQDTLPKDPDGAVGRVEAGL